MVCVGIGGSGQMARSIQTDVSILNSDTVEIFL